MPDGLAVMGSRGGELFAFPVDGSEPRLLFAPQDGNVYGFERWPGHDAVVVRTQTALLSDHPEHGQRSTGLGVALWIVPLSGSAPRRIIYFDQPELQMHRPEFAVWGDRVYLTVGEFQSDVWVMELLPGD
jgi:hypothetical protein